MNLRLVEGINSSRIVKLFKADPHGLRRTHAAPIDHGCITNYDERENNDHGQSPSVHKNFKAHSRFIEDSLPNARRFQHVRPVGVARASAGKNGARVVYMQVLHAQAHSMVPLGKQVEAGERVCRIGFFGLQRREHPFPDVR